MYQEKAGKTTNSAIVALKENAEDFFPYFNFSSRKIKIIQSFIKPKDL